MLSTTMSNVRPAHLLGTRRELTSGTTLAHLWLGRRDRRSSSRRTRWRRGWCRCIVTTVIAAIVVAVVATVVTTVGVGGILAGSWSAVSLTIAQSSHDGSSGVLHNVGVANDPVSSEQIQTLVKLTSDQPH